MRHQRMYSPFTLALSPVLVICLGLVTGLSLCCPAAAEQVCSSFAAINIPDNSPAGTSGSLSTTRTATIQDLNIKLNADHSWVGDLVIKLKHVETGTTVTLIDRIGVPASPQGCARDNLNITLDDEGTGGLVESTCTSSTPLFPTSPPAFIPNNPLSAFDGQTITGTWQLLVSDHVTGDFGKLNSFCLSWNSTDISVSANASKNFVGTGSKITYTIDVANNGPYEAEEVNLLEQIPTGMAISKLSLSKGTYTLIPVGFPFSNLLNVMIPNLPAGQHAILTLELFVSGVRVFPGPIPDSTVLRISSPQGAPTELPTYMLNFNVPVHGTSVSGQIVLANDGVAALPGALTSDACEPLSAVDVAGKIVLADSVFAPLPPYSGTPPPPPCSTDQQMANAKAAGAKGLILVNITDNAVPMFAFSPPPGGTFEIPVIVIGRKLAASLRAGGNATIEVAAAGVWEVINQVVINDSGDDPDESNNLAVNLGIVGRDSDEDGEADAIDLCPADPAKTALGICGCGRIDNPLDVNFNGLADCNESSASLIPPTPTLRRVKNSVRVTMPMLSGASYVMTARIKAPGKKKTVKKIFRSTKNVVSIPNVRGGSTVTVSYSFAFGATGVATQSAQSPEKSLRVK